MQGFAVIEAGDGTAAVDQVRARADDIDVIVLDVMLPGIPSWEVLREARRLRPGIKIILMSAYSKDYVRRYFEGAAIDGRSHLSWARSWGCCERLWAKTN
jgi:CheY-like chemotaxis protein